MFAPGHRLGWELSLGEWHGDSIGLGFTSFQNQPVTARFPSIPRAEHGRDPGPPQLPCRCQKSREKVEVPAGREASADVSCAPRSLHFMGTPVHGKVRVVDFSLLNHLNQSFPPVTTGKGEGNLAFKTKVYFGSSGFAIDKIL